MAAASFFLGASFCAGAGAFAASGFLSSVFLGADSSFLSPAFSLFAALLACTCASIESAAEPPSFVSVAAATAEAAQATSAAISIIVKSFFILPFLPYVSLIAVSGAAAASSAYIENYSIYCFSITHYAEKCYFQLSYIHCAARFASLNSSVASPSGVACEFSRRTRSQSLYSIRESFLAK
ncbi:hypothetical protein SDC9_112901 [bioreactor metagenome]|uniref:Uncharacterized protein n=1 Tax=bioreactor metagenome TaxID=1076179 RepID=A0A645BL17_9ZZZZ